MKNEMVVIDEDNIKDKIYYIRGKEVMLDSDLAKIYGYSTKDFNRQVKNNIERFDDDFRFQLTSEDINYLSRCKNFTSMQTKGIKGGRTSNLYAFTEDIFKDKMIFKGELYDGYSLILDILNKAKNEIIIIDNYTNKEILDLVSKLNVKVTVVSVNLNDELINKYQTQYNNLTIINNDSFHDRFIIIDRKFGYFLGSSIKDIGKKISFVGSIDKKLVDLLLNEINIYLK